MSLGLIAQEVRQIFPHLVHEDPDPGIMSLNDSVVRDIAIKAIREQQKIIDDLEIRIQAMEQLLNQKQVDNYATNSAEASKFF